MSYHQILEAVREHRDNLDGYTPLGDIRVIQHGDLLMFSYRREAMFKGTWNSCERVSRGLIVNWKTAKFVAVPFEKFFNLGERPETQLNQLPDGPFEVTAKLDGSLGILYHHDGEWHIANRGIFETEQSLWATQYANKHFNLQLLDIGTTLLFEIIHPNRRIILDYGKDAMLTLIGARTFHPNGGPVFDHGYEGLRRMADRYNCPLVEMYRSRTIDRLLTASRSDKGIEGWVLRWPGGFRVKIKTAEYMRLHKIVTGFSPKRIREVLMDGTADQYIAQLPEEIQHEARDYVGTIIRYVKQESDRIRSIMRELEPVLQESRKAFAIAVIAYYYQDRGYLFALADHKNIEPMLLRDAPLKSLFGLALEEPLREDLLW